MTESTSERTAQDIRMSVLESENQRLRQELKTATKRLGPSYGSQGRVSSLRVVNMRGEREKLSDKGFCEELAHMFSEQDAAGFRLKETIAPYVFLFVADRTSARYLSTNDIVRELQSLVENPPEPLAPGEIRRGTDPSEFWYLRKLPVGWERTLHSVLAALPRCCGHIISAREVALMLALVASVNRSIEP